MSCLSKRFFNRFIPADLSRTRPWPASSCADSGGKEQDFTVESLKPVQRTGKRNVIALRGLSSYEAGFSFLGTPQELLRLSLCHQPREIWIFPLLGLGGKKSHKPDPGKIVSWLRRAPSCGHFDFGAPQELLRGRGSPDSALYLRFVPKAAHGFCLDYPYFVDESQEAKTREERACLRHSG